MTAAILAALTAILGAVAGGFLRERGDRKALLRDRRLAAADDFVAAATEVFVGLTEAHEQLPQPTSVATASTWVVKMDAATAEARTHVHAVTRRAARLELLFGRGSPTASSGMELVRSLLSMTQILKDHRADVDAFSADYDKALDAMTAFTENAHDAIIGKPRRERGLHRVRDRVLRRAGPPELESGQADSEQPPDKDSH